MFEGWDAVVLARAQFAFTMSFHIVFPAFSIALQRRSHVTSEQLAIASTLRFDGVDDLATGDSAQQGESWMTKSWMTKFRHPIWMTIAAVGLMLSASHSFAQQPDVGDQPGLLPDDSVELDPEYQKQMVYYRTTEAPGTIIISTAERHLYLIQGNGRALRYGIGVGRDGFQWQGLLNISRKAEWPDWTPPPEMIARQPYLPRFMAGGPGNPLGARAMYLGTTVYRIHGTNRPDTIGTKVSSGCFRLVNADVADLYDRVPVGTKVIVRQKPEL
jgi:lipoprotein-anchoring transpeptidase ErfK/SrfK